MNKIESYVKVLISKGVPETSEGMLIVRRYEHYFKHLNNGDIQSIYNIFAFYNVLKEMEKIVNNTLVNKNAFTGITGLFERAYISKSSGKIDSFIVFLPSDFNQEKDYPLIIFLHGYGEWVYLPIDSTAHHELLAACNRKSVILAAPCGKHVPHTGVPSYERGEEDVLQVIQIVMSSYKIRPGKIYLTGVSMGGHGTWYIGSRHGELFSAIAPVCGFGKGEFDSPLVNIDSLSQLPQYVFHGETDTIVPVSSSRVMVKEMKKRGFEISYKELPNVGHDCWDTVYGGDFLLDRLLEH
jgi:predicted peptidase